MIQRGLQKQAHLRVKVYKHIILLRNVGASSGPLARSHHYWIAVTYKKMLISSVESNILAPQPSHYHRHNPPPQLSTWDRNTVLPTPSSLSQSFAPFLISSQPSPPPLQQLLTWRHHSHPLSPPSLYSYHEPVHYFFHILKCDLQSWENGP